MRKPRVIDTRTIRISTIFGLLMFNIVHVTLCYVLFDFFVK